MKRSSLRLFPRTSSSTERTLVDLLRNERVGGTLMLVATAAALAWANSPWSGGYGRLLRFVPWDASVTLGGSVDLHVDLSLEQWAKDGILAIFFFVVGLELKREIVAGELRRPSSAIAAHRRRRRRDARARRRLPRHQRALRERGRGRVGDPHRHRHRLRARGAVRRRPLPPQLRARLPADPRRRRRPLRDPRSSRSSTPTGFSSAWLGIALVPLAVFAFLARTRRLTLATMIPLGARDVGLHRGVRRARDDRRRRARPRGSRHPRERASAIAPRSNGSTGGGPCRRASPFRCSPSSPRASRSTERRCGPPSTIRRPWASPLAW